MNDLSDEKLMAFVDGELSADEAQFVERQLAGHPVARAKLEVFQGTGRNLGDLFSAPMTADIPERLIRAASGTISSRTATNVVPMTRASKPQSPIFNPWAMAAGLALVVGIGAAWIAIPGRTLKSGFDMASLVDGTGAAQQPLSEGLDRLASNQDGQLEGTSSPSVLHPDFSFVSKAGEFCRQYRLEMGSEKSANVACRRTDGKWHVEKSVALVPTVRTADSPIVPAGKTPSDIDQVVDNLIAGDVFGAVQESEVIKTGWRKRIEE